MESGTIFLDDRSKLRSHMPAGGRKAILWFVIVLSFIRGGVVMFFLAGDVGLGWRMRDKS